MNQQNTPMMYEKIRSYIDANGISRKTMALNMGIAESRLSLLLNGKRRMTVEDYLSMCRAISVSPVRFIES